ncbi:MAG TPA: STM3941 family protein [Mucilaginibacter sp.]
METNFTAINDGGICYWRFFFIINPSAFEDSGFRHSPKIEILIIGYACVIFFGAGTVILTLRLFDNKPGLLIDDQEITINPYSFSTSIIEWTKIEKINIKEIYRTKIIMVYLKRPQEFIDQINNPFKRKMALFSLKTYGTPVSITASGLKYNTDELYALLMARLQNR